MWPLGGYACHDRWPYTHAFTGHTKWTSFIKRKKKEEGMEMEGIEEELEGGMGVVWIQTY